MTKKIIFLNLDRKISNKLSLTGNRMSKKSKNVVIAYLFKIRKDVYEKENEKTMGDVSGISTGA